ncbi:MAG: polyprenyl synthetase family protein [Clostridia bacterium]|nr:polyprenyl synthetase family protein [Clostridia bacterium]
MFEIYEKLIEARLNEILSNKECEYSHLIEAMAYSAEAGGKRIRPKLLMEFMRVAGGQPENALNFACALEMIHTYSLIHDDLPCMDDDDMRRGRPSCHIKFGEATALLAGDALLTDAFKIALSTENVPFERVCKAAKVLSECAGSDGMIGGQIIDLKYEEQKAPLTVVLDLYRLKTGALLKAAATIGCILAGANDEIINASCVFAEKIGLAFQIRDDILDIISTAEELGKPIGSDAESEKSTYVSLVGLDKAQEDVVSFTNEAINALEAFSADTTELKAFALKLIERRN